jgi:hypothetical protein
MTNANITPMAPSKTDRPSNRQTIAIALSAVAIAALSACGGGAAPKTVAPSPTSYNGLPETPVAMPNPQVQPNPQDAAGTQPLQPAQPILAEPGTLVDNAAHALLSTIAQGSVELQYFNEINLARGQGGFGLLAQDASLDRAARAHSAYFDVQFNKPFYITAAGTYARYTGVEPLDKRYAEPVVYYYDESLYGQIDAASAVLKAHVEVPGLPGFIGVLAVNRANAAGYAGGKATFVSEIIGFENHRDPLDKGCVSVLLRTVFHRGILLETASVDVGIGTFLSVGGKLRNCVINTSSARTALARAPDGWVGVFPGVGASNMFRSLPGEVPNPVPEFAVMGLPVSLFVGRGHIFKVSQFTLTVVGETTPVPVKLLTQTEFPQYIKSHQSYVVPKGALKPKTTYRVVFAGADDGRELNKTWTFTTGA